MITFERFSYTYPGAAQPALREVGLRVPAGAFALVVGRSGTGKSTLLRCLNGLAPHFSGGAVSGALRVDGLDPVQLSPRGMCRHVGVVFQDPESQFVTDRVEDEIAFALENAAMPTAQMRVRVEEALDLLQLAGLRRRGLSTLSGGEQQRVAIAAALALRPRVLALDEPTSQLDPQSAEDVLNALVRLNHELGLTVVLAEHRMERVLPFADMLINTAGDGVVQAGQPREMLMQLPIGPPLVALGKRMGWTPLPITLKEALPWARAVPAPASHPHASSPDAAREPLIEVSGLDVRYDRAAALEGVSLTLGRGETVALMGRNGSGKTTLLKAIVGLVARQRGSVVIHGVPVTRDRRGNVLAPTVAEVCTQVGYLPQDPNALLFADTAAEELRITLRNHGLPETPGRVAELLARVGLEDKAGAYPRDLSVGERQRLALAAITVTDPRALLLDEPTRGLDYEAKDKLVRLIAGWRARGMGVLIVTHDVELAAQLADRVVLLSRGAVIADGSPWDTLAASQQFSPQIARLFPGRGWLTMQDAYNSLHP